MSLILNYRRISGCLFIVLVFSSFSFIATTIYAVNYTAETLRETQAGVRARLHLDAVKISTLVAKSSLNPTVKSASLVELADLETQVESLNFPEEEFGFRAILPLHPIHEDMFKIYSRVLAQDSSSPLSVWHTLRFDKLDLFAKPAGNVSRLEMRMMKNERRSTAINITNATEEKRWIDISITNLPTGANFKVYQGEYVDTKYPHRGPGSEYSEGPSALIEVTGPKYQILVHSGMSRQLIFMIDSKNVVPGDYTIYIDIDSEIFQKIIDLNVSVADVTFPDQPDYSLPMWDFIGTGRHRGIIPANQAAAAIDYADHFGNAPVIAPVISRNTVPLPERNDFDPQGNLNPVFDFSIWNLFMEIFPDAKYYIAFLDQQETTNFGGFIFGRPEWKRAVGTWAAGFAAYMVSCGKKSSQLVLYFMDEPRTGIELVTAAMYVEAVEDMAPEVTTMITINAKMGVTSTWGERVINSTDILVPFRDHFFAESSQQTYYDLTEEERDIYRNLQTRGKQLWLYGIGYKWGFSPESRLLDIWRDFYNNAEGSGYWGYADIGHNPSNWNMYPNHRTDGIYDDYSPLYIDEQSVTTSRQWESIREAVENVQYSIMLRERIDVLEAEKKEILEGLGIMLTDITHGKDLLAFLPSTAQEVEETRLEILETLVRLKGEPPEPVRKKFPWFIFMQIIIGARK